MINDSQGHVDGQKHDFACPPVRLEHPTTVKTLWFVNPEKQSGDDTERVEGTHPW